MLSNTWSGGILLLDTVPAGLGGGIGATATLFARKRVARKLRTNKIYKPKPYTLVA